MRAAGREQPGSHEEHHRNGELARDEPKSHAPAAARW